MTGKAGYGVLVRQVKID